MINKPNYIPFSRKCIQLTKGVAKKCVQRILYRKGASVPVFLTGCGRSGTNFIVGRLNKTWEIRLYNETDQDAFHDWRLKELDIIDGLIKNSYAPIILFKPINDTYRMIRLLERFDNAKIIFQFRHYNDVVNSITRGPFGQRKALVKHWIESDFDEFKLYLPTLDAMNTIRELFNDGLNDDSGSALYWLLQNRFLFDQGLQHNPNVILVQYECLVQDSEEVLGKLFKFIDVTYKEEATKGVKLSSINKNQTPDIEPDILTACEELWAKLIDVAGGSGEQMALKSLIQ
ncbi:MAG TPA: hypothetical protein ENI67_07315 [Gammaproteobacteria bacterium]|nr:hypothetical protein [Gammaproteobacteria bacterium]